ncbi:hypothetical protein EJ06DRAFT_49864 [Trichodelitschia bisporula]|uniref:Uncharacterized protein n=1 Tax=Trichodelitschia bisporula TaxID=703511 RepID=A0A6G1HTQ3_9PEZI|nr:hypothetical protein EJ06DRAFT_49864 [Trichodelitschia bisporula]
MGVGFGFRGPSHAAFWPRSVVFRLSPMLIFVRAIVEVFAFRVIPRHAALRPGKRSIGGRVIFIFGVFLRKVFLNHVRPEHVALRLGDLMAEGLGRLRLTIGSHLVKLSRRRSKRSGLRCALLCFESLLHEVILFVHGGPEDTLWKNISQGQMERVIRVRCRVVCGVDSQKLCSKFAQWACCDYVSTVMAASETGSVEGMMCRSLLAVPCECSSNVKRCSKKPCDIWYLPAWMGISRCM